MQKDDKKVGNFFWFKIMYLRVSGNFYEVDSILERERESEKKPLRLFCFTQDLVYDFSQATLIISVGFCNFFWYTHLG